MFAFFGLVSKLSAPLKLKNKFSPFIAHELFSTKFSQSELLKARKLQTPTDIGQMLKNQLKPWLTQYVWNFGERKKNVKKIFIIHVHTHNNTY